MRKRSYVRQKQQILQEFVTKAEEYRLNKWLTNGETTYDVWTKLKLEDIPIDELNQFPAFKTYVKYAQQFDDDAYRNWRAYDHPQMVGNSEKEMSVKLWLWAEHKRPDEYVRMALGLER
ncbi:hypothetical protein PPTG_08384 [Phytophthora nicotianae INRA-310]|uniref:RxLR effector protein n=1 Tax=Phytophthora nicotianae (strain INRA-310) TaxID=761204 RepID=W2QM81_PHYN3|nr:hypothetical protein PPTG_08384 [Phytophthora nicotianae INRA-310]ETN13629.1 hypothetical protein PPTG_08384 [Phytophthora nicotianae INRA-310]